MTNAVRRALTLMELVVSIAIISILAALLAPGIEAARSAAQSAVCLHNQRSLMLLTEMYVQDYDGRLVRSRKYYDESGHEKIWTYALAPYMGGAHSVALCPVRGAAEAASVYSEDWAGRDLLNMGINRNLETKEGFMDEWLPVPPGAWRVSQCHAPGMTWFFGDSFCGKRGFQVRLDRQVDGQSSFSTRHGGKVQLAFLDGHVAAFPVEALTDEAGLTVAADAAGVWWFPHAAPPEWVVP